MDILAARVGGPFFVVRGHQFGSQRFVGRLPLLLTNRQHDPANRQRLLAGPIDLHRHLIRSAADALRPNFDRRLDVINRRREDVEQAARLSTLRLQTRVDMPSHNLLLVFGPAPA